MTLKKAIKLFLDNLRELKRSQDTVKTYRKNLDLFYQYLSKRNNCEIYVDNVSADDMENYLRDKCNSDTYSSAYRFNMITAFKSLYTFCYMKGYCNRDISKQTSLVKRRIKERTYLTKEEFEKLITAINHPSINAVVQTMYYTGLRINECRKLSINDVDFDRNCITVIRDKENNKRTIPINYKLREVLLQYFSIYRDTKKASELFFSTRTGTISDTYVNAGIKEAAIAVGLNKDVTCHIMRHSFASNLVANGIDIYKVQVLLGHKSLKTTSIYLHTNMNELKKAVNLIN